MKRVCITLAVVALVCLSAGCAGLTSPGSYSTTGWSFNVGRPATLATVSPTVIAQGPGPVAVQPLGSLSAVAPHPIAAPLPIGPAAMESTPSKGMYWVTPRGSSAGPSGCTLDDVCAKLDEVLRTLGARKE